MDYTAELQKYLDTTYAKRKMDSNVFDLGVKLQKHFSAAKWAAWMTDAELFERPEAIIIYHKSDFYSKNADHLLGFNIGEHFKRPVIFKISKSIQGALL